MTKNIKTDEKIKWICKNDLATVYRTQKDAMLK